MRNPAHQRGAFTLTELLIAVLVLLVVIAATARIFGTAQRVSSVGEANASILQEATAIERRLRDDLSRLSDQGYMAIRNVAIKNDINDVASTAQVELLNPDLPPEAVLRLDQLVFFTQGAQDTLDFIGGVNLGSGAIPAGMVSRVMYGHGVQVPDRVKQAANELFRFNPDTVLANGRPLSPWVVDTDTAVGGLRLTSTSTGPTLFVNGTQPGARDWILSRRAILLADDGGVPTYLGISPNTPQLDANSFEWIVRKQAGLQWFPSGVLQPSPEVLSGRYDICAMQPDDIERVLCRFEGTNPVTTPLPPVYAPWTVVTNVVDLPSNLAQFGPVRQRVINATFGLGVTQNQAGVNVPIGLACWPRVEREPPTIDKSDQMLTSGMIGGHCSSFIVEWCWRDGVGRLTDENGQVVVGQDPLATAVSSVPMLGYAPGAPGQQSWIGLPDDAFGLSTPSFQRRGTSTLQATGAVRWPLFAPAIEGPNGAQVLPMVGAGIPANKAWCYTSVFGFNASEPTYWVNVLDPSASPQQRRVRVPRLDYCPRPSALRISMTLHDPDRRIDGGREFTFVIDLPERSTP